jgi:hypothetical protein
MSHVLARSDHIFLASGVVAVCAGRTHSDAGWRHSPGSIGMRVSPLQGTSISEAPATGGHRGVEQRRFSIAAGFDQANAGVAWQAGLELVCVTRVLAPIGRIGTQDVR